MESAYKGRWNAYAETLAGRIVTQANTPKLYYVDKIVPGLSVDVELAGEWRKRYVR